MAQTVCPECGSALEEGFVPGRITLGLSSGGYVELAWHAGKPVGDRARRVKDAKKTKTPITALRCTKCGLLKFYTTPSAD
jgi:hypothetical protein